MVLGGRVNKSLVALIQQAGGAAVGLCGKDSDIIRARQMVEKDIGFVGEVTKVDAALLRVRQPRRGPLGGRWGASSGAALRRPGQDQRGRPRCWKPVGDGASGAVKAQLRPRDSPMTGRLGRARGAAPSP